MLAASGGPRAVCAYFAWESATHGCRVVGAHADEVWLKSVIRGVLCPDGGVPIVPFRCHLLPLLGIFPPLVGSWHPRAIPLNFAITYWLSKTFMRPLASGCWPGEPKIPTPSTRVTEFSQHLIRICGTPYTFRTTHSTRGVSFRDYMVFGLPFIHPRHCEDVPRNSLLKGEGRKAVMPSPSSSPSRSRPSSPRTISRGTRRTAPASAHPPMPELPANSVLTVSGITELIRGTLDPRWGVWCRGISNLRRQRAGTATFPRRMRARTPRRAFPQNP
jgi:hypothetical protein